MSDSAREGRWREVTKQTIDRVICAKDVDRSLLRQGFTLHEIAVKLNYRRW